MADDRHDEEQELKITVRDRRRVTTEGELRDIPDEPAPAPAPADSAPVDAQGGLRLVEDEDEGLEAGLETGGYGQPGDDDEVEMPVLRDLTEPEDDGPAEGAPGEPPPIRNVTDYLAQVTVEMNLWALSALGLVGNPMTGLIATDMNEAAFAIDAAEGLLDLLGDRLAPEQRMGLAQSFIIQFAQIAAQLLQQPPQVRLAQISAIRFSIDTAERFLKRLVAEEAPEQVTSQLSAALRQLKLEFLQASGGGGIIG
ncbi:MAG TPA: hypothetical protein DCZ72_12490 [Armatimonadetes bacterium]|nr:hypothetical protein [Armatimonadota bacterium]